MNDELFERACSYLARRLLVLGPGEPVVILVDQGADRELACQLRERMGPERAQIGDLGDMPAEAAERALERYLDPLMAAPGLKSMVELSERTYYASPTVARFLAAGGRVLALGNLSKDAFARCVGGMDTAALQNFGAALNAILSSAERIEIRTADGVATMRMTPTSKQRVRSSLLRQGRSTIFPSTIPVVAGQLAFLPGQAAFLGVPETIQGRLRVDGYLTLAGWVPQEMEPMELEMKRGVVTAMRGGAAETIRALMGSRDTTLQHFCIGFHPAARPDSSLMEAERTLGAVTVGFGTYPFHADGVIREADLIVDGEWVLRKGRFVHPRLSEATSALPSTGEAEREPGRIDRWLQVLGLISKYRFLPQTRYAAAGKEARCVGYPPWEKYLLHLYLGAKAAPEPIGTTTLLSLGDGVRAITDGVGLTLVGAPSLAVRHNGLDQIALHLPAYLGLALPLTGLQKLDDRENVRRVKRAGLSAEWAGYEDRRFGEFYESYYAPTALWHGEFAVLQSFGALQEEARSGELLIIRKGEEPVAMGLFVRSGRQWRLSQFGVREGDRSLSTQYGLVTIYYYGIMHGVEIGCERMTLGRSVPVLTNGVVRHKVGWGCRAEPLDDEQSPLQVILDPRRPEALQMLEAHPLAVFAPGGDRQRLFGLGALAGTDVPDNLKAILRNRWAPGLRSFLLLVDGPAWLPRIETLRERARALGYPFQFQTLPADPSPRWLIETAREHFQNAPER